MPASRRLRLAREITNELRRREARNLVAVGVYGSVARGEERDHSDLDLLVVVRVKRARIRTHVRQGVLVTVLQHTPAEARAEVLGSRPDLNDALGGWRAMRPLYDPRGLLGTLKVRSRRPTRAQFRKAARGALLATYEDLGKLRDAAAAGDAEEVREMAVWFTGGAMGLLFDLEGYVPRTGRRAFIEARRFGPVGQSVWALRYRNPSLAKTVNLAESIWADLRARARSQGIRIEDVP